MLNTFKICLLLLVTCSAVFAPAPIFVSDNLESIYAADPNDSWNRIFRALFTRRLKARVSDAFPEGAPFETFQVRMGSFPIRLSKQKLIRTELGDRAIEPLYPTFFTAEGPAQALNEQFSELTTALRQTLDETKNRSAIERALMQSDAWAAYDIVYRARPDIPQRKEALLTLLRQFIRKLALTTDEIKSLKSNYLDAVHTRKLPNLFSAESGWLEIELLPERLHDQATRFRRATRVFVKPRTTHSDPSAFVESLKYNQHQDQVEAVALIIQNLLIDTSARVVPSPIITDIQFRFFKNDAKTGTITADLQQFELSRRKLFTEPTSGGFVEYLPSSPAYLAAAGNDYEFATPIEEAGAPIVVPLRTRCAQCHNAPLTTVLTYAIHGIPPVPTTRILRPLDQERALYTARLKEARDDFKSLTTTQ